MRAKFVFEKFSEESDPIHDMGIGKIDFSEKYHEILAPAEMEWDEYLSQFVGKTISGVMRKLGSQGGSGASGIAGSTGFSGIAGNTGAFRSPGTQNPFNLPIQGIHMGHGLSKTKIKIKNYIADITDGSIIIEAEDGSQYKLLTNEETYIIE
jgi:hypothetical protein